MENTNEHSSEDNSRILCQRAVKALLTGQHGQGHRAMFSWGQKTRAPIKGYNVKVPRFCLPSSNLLFENHAVKQPQPMANAT